MAITDKAKKGFIYGLLKTKIMTKEELIKELELLADSCDSNYALELNGYNRGVLNALDLVNKYFALAHVSNQLCDCKDFTIKGKMLVCKDCGKEHKSLSA